MLLVCSDDKKCQCPEVPNRDTDKLINPNPFIDSIEIANKTFFQNDPLEIPSNSLL